MNNKPETNNKGPAMGCAVLLALLAGGLFVLWACARAVGCGLGIV